MSMEDLIQQWKNNVPLSLTAHQAVSLLESVFCDASPFLQGDDWEQPTSLAQVLGMTLSGIRTSVRLDATSLASELSSLQQATRHQAGLVAYHVAESSTRTQFKGDHTPFFQLANSGAVLFYASNAQELLDFSIIARKVAEQGLVPCVCGLDAELLRSDQTQVQLPRFDTVADYLGTSRDPIECPTPAQKMVFGPTRRRLPIWFNPDLPMLHGASKDSAAQQKEALARELFASAHLSELVVLAMEDFGKVTGRTLQAIQSHQLNDAEHAVVLLGANDLLLKEFTQQARTKGVRLGCVNFKQLQPFPAQALASLLTGKVTITVLERSFPMLNQHPPLFQAIASAQSPSQAQISARPKRFFGFQNPIPPTTVWISGVWTQPNQPINSTGLELVLENLLSTANRKTRFFLGLPASAQLAGLPQLQAMRDQLKANYPDWEQGLLLSPSPTNALDGKRSKPPTWLTNQKEQVPPYASLAQFYHQNSLLYQMGSPQAMLVDPAKALSVVPAWSAHLRKQVEAESLPTFNAEACTACGSCFTYCPHAAINPLVVNWENLLKSSQQILASQTPLKQFPSISKNLAKLANRVSRDNQSAPLSAVVTLGQAFALLAAKSDWDEARQHDLESELDSVLEVVSTFDFAFTATLYFEPAAEAPQNGELFGLVLNPQSCTSCGLCVSACPEQAWEMEAITDSSAQRLSEQNRLWEQIPDVSNATLLRLLDNAQYPSLSALLLSRYYRFSVSGASAGRRAQAAKVLLRWISALVEFNQQPKTQQLATRVQKQIEALQAVLQDRLLQFAPLDDLPQLKALLDVGTAAKVSLSQLLSQLESQQIPRHINTQWMKGILTSLEELRTLHWSLVKGHREVGRSRMTLSLHASPQQSGQSWAQSFPDNPFAMPVMLQLDEQSSEQSSEQSPELTLGLLKGQQLQHLIQSKRLRRAEWLAAGTYDPDVHEAELANLGWEDLTEDERSCMPPMLVVVFSESLSRLPEQQLHQLLSLNAPIKLLLVHAFNESVDQSPGKFFTNCSRFSLTCLTQRSVPMVQTVFSKDLFADQEVLKVLGSNAPGLINVLLPADFRAEANLPHEFTWELQAQLALASRTFPAFHFNPGADGGFGLNLDLTNNPEVEKEAAEVSIQFMEGNTEKTKTILPTVADWASVHPGFAPHFRAVESEEDHQSDRVAVVWKVNDEKHLVPFRVSDAMRAAVKQVSGHWRMLQEIAGIQTPFTERIQLQLEQELRTKHERELQQLKRQHEAELAALSEQSQQRMHQELSDRLMALAGFDQTSCSDSNRESV